MRVEKTTLPEVFVVEPDVFEDVRGCFFEIHHAERYVAAGVTARFVQDNVSCSARGVLRGLHFQHPNGQAKLVQALTGEIFDVAVDVRRGSPDFGRWVSVILSSMNKRQIYIPEGFAHGFCALSETATVLYKCDRFYAPATAHAIRWDDPDLAINWPVAAPLLSEKDAAAPALRDLPPSALPAYVAPSPGA